MGNSAVSNDSDGIRASGDSHVERNWLHDNGAAGLELNSTTTYRGNTVTGNGTAGVVDTALGFPGINLGDNYCAGTGVTSQTCP